MDETDTRTKHPTLRLWIGEDGSIVGPKGKVLSQFIGQHGYLRINTYTARTNKWRQHSVHVLVCETFHGPRPEGKFAAHNDGDKLNVAASNLSWKTQSENEADKVAHGTAMLGSRHHQAKLTEADVIRIRSARAAGFTAVALATQFGIHPHTVRAIVRRSIWKHI